jgi:hypothetical protein
MAHRDVDRPKPEDMPSDNGSYLRPWPTFKMDALTRVLNAGIGKNGYISPFMHPFSGTFCQQHIRHVRNYTTDNNYLCGSFSSPFKSRHLWPEI